MTCYACTCTTLDHSQHQFAPAAPLSSRAIGGRRSLLLASAATLSIIHDQTETHGAGGASLRHLGADGARVPVPVPARSVLAGQGYVSSLNLAGRFGVRSLFHFGAQPRRQAIAEQPPIIHFKHSSFTANQLNGGAEHDAGSITQGRGND